MLSRPHLPDFDRFSQLAIGHDLVPIYRRISSDILTPVSAFYRLQQKGSHGACLFESVVGGEKVGRHSFLAVEPYLRIWAFGNEVHQWEGGVETTMRSDHPLSMVKNQIQKRRLATLDELPPFVGGAVGYAGYDAVRYTEHLPNPPLDDRQLPDLQFAFFDQMIVFDHIQKTVLVVVLADVSKSEPSSIRTAFETACERVDTTLTKLTNESPSLAPAEIGNWHDLPEVPAFASNFQHVEFENAVRRCVDYIRAGDIFQVVLSQRFQANIQSEPFEIYRSLRCVNPSPFMFYLRTPEASLVGSSPEILCRVVADEVTVRPLAGTRPRGFTEEADRQLEADLLADPKERAEHVMLVDLGRNDIGRIARYGSVELSDVMSVERYSHVMHITSNIRARLRDGLDAFDALGACLPAGTVSGAPKVRAMQIIDELEPHRRGPYAGAVGYFDFSGNMDTCIALRTIVVQGETAYVQAGAGIVADSNPRSEYEETWSKARGLLKAIWLTECRRKSRSESPDTRVS